MLLGPVVLATAGQVEEQQAKMVGLRVVLLSEQQQHQQRGKGRHLPSVGS